MKKTPSRMRIGSSWFTVVFLLIITVSLALRFIAFTNTYVVNVLYSDQWELYLPFIGKPSLFNLFTYQYGPHRQGVGSLLSYAIAILSHWDVRAEVLLNAIIQIGTLLLIFILKRRLFQKWHVLDVLFPVLVFSYKYFESFIVVPNASHAVLPIFFTFLLAIIWTFNHSWKYYFFPFIAILAIFTGFGLFIGPFVFILLIQELINKRFPVSTKIHVINSLILLTGGFGMFLYGYYWDTAVTCSISPSANWPKYHIFMGSMVANFFTHQSSPISNSLQYFGLLVFISIIGVFIYRVRHIFRQKSSPDTFSGVQILLTGITILFIVFSTIGRTCLGVEAARADRYVLYLLPAFVALYFESIAKPLTQMRKILLGCIVAIFVMSEWFVSADITAIAKSYQQLKERWVSCYLHSRSAIKCNNLLQFKIAPSSIQYHVNQVLQYVEDNQLHIFQK